MSACTGSNSLECDCTAITVAPLNITMPKNGNDLPFVGFASSGILQLDQTEAGIAISAIPPFDAAYYGLVEQNFNAQIVNQPMIFDALLPGWVNTGIYNTLTGVTTIATSGIYSLSAQFTIGGTPFSTTQFDRQFRIEINGIVTLPSFFNTSFSNQTITIAGSAELSLTAGDTIRILVVAGNASNYTIFGGIDSFFSIRQL